MRLTRLHLNYAKYSLLSLIERMGYFCLLDLYFFQTLQKRKIVNQAIRRYIHRTILVPASYNTIWK